MTTPSLRRARSSEAVRPDASGLPLLLLPGTVCDQRLFAPVLELLDHRPALVAEMRGARSAPALARKILAEAPEQFALAGFSLGGIVALEIAAQAPGRIARLALIDTTPRPDKPANAALRRAAVAAAQADGMEGYILGNWANLVAPGNAGRADLRDVIVAMARDAGPDLLADQSEVALGRADSRPRLAAIAIPTLVLAGAEERVCSIDAHREMADAVPGAILRLVPGAGHFAPLENPAAVAAHLRAWLSGESDGSARYEPTCMSTEEPP